MNQMKKQKIIIISIAAVIVLGFAAHFILKASPKDGYRLVTTTIKMNKISSTVTATGTIEPITEVTVGTQVSGKVSKIYVDYNSIVKKGQVLAEIDKTNLETALHTQELAVQSAKVEYQYQKTNYERSQDLRAKNLISAYDFETAQYTYEQAKSSYEQAESNLAKAKTDLGYATIYSPINGVVLSRDVEEGQTVAASFSTPTMFVIAKDLTKMQVVADVDEADIGTVAVNQRVTFTVDAYPNDVFNGTVTQVRLNPTTTSNVVTYQVIINAPNPDLKLKPGLTANITIFTLEKNHVMTLPNQALDYSPDTLTLAKDGYTVYENAHYPLNNDTRTVWVEHGHSIFKRVIEVGPTDGINTEILSGLKDTDHVALKMVERTKDEQLSSNEESSPFMPKRPGRNRRNGK